MGRSVYFSKGLFMLLQGTGGELPHGAAWPDSVRTYKVCSVDPAGPDAAKEVDFDRQRKGDAR